jgi:hypothetical protein
MIIDSYLNLGDSRSIFALGSMTTPFHQVNAFTIDRSSILTRLGYSNVLRCSKCVNNGLGSDLYWHLLFGEAGNASNNSVDVNPPPGRSSQLSI